MIAITQEVTEERQVAEFRSQQLYHVEIFSDGITIDVYVCSVIDTEGDPGTVDGYVIRHKYYDDESGELTITPLTKFWEWR